MIGVEGLERILPGAGDAAEGAVLLGAQAVVAPLDEAAAGRDHAADAQPYDVARRGEEDRLHESLAERAAPQQERAVVVLERGGQGLGGARAATVDQDDQRRAGELAVALGYERRVDFLLPPPGAEHHRVLGEELRCKLHGRAYLATGGSAEVQDELGGALAPQPLEGVMHLGRSLFSELIEAHVPRRGIGEPHDRDRWNLDVFPFERDRKRVGLEAWAAFEAQVNLGSLVAGQPELERPRIQARDGGVVDEGEPVAGLEAGFVRRALEHDRQDARGAVHVLEHQAGDGELAALELGGLVAIDVRLEAAVWIERLQDSVNRGADQLRVGHGVHVIHADVIQHCRERLQLFIGGRLPRCGLLRGHADRYGEQADGGRKGMRTQWGHRAPPINVQSGWRTAPALGWFAAP